MVGRGGGGGLIVPFRLPHGSSHEVQPLFWPCRPVLCVSHFAVAVPRLTRPWSLCVPALVLPTSVWIGWLRVSQWLYLCCIRSQCGGRKERGVSSASRGCINSVYVYVSSV